MKRLWLLGCMGATIVAGANEAWRGELVKVRNVQAVTSIKSNGPGTDNTLITTLSLDVPSNGCAVNTDFIAVNHVSDPGNKMGVLSIYRAKREAPHCKGQFLDNGQPLAGWQRIKLTLPPEASWAGEGQTLQNAIAIPTQVKNAE